METPNKMIGGIAGAMAQQTGAIDQTTGMAVQPGQIQPNPMVNSRALGGAQENLIPGMFPGSAFQQDTKSSRVANLLNAKTSTEAGIATAAITDAQKKALEKKKLKETMKKAAAETATEVSQDVVSGERKKQ
jgi:hypothetical protein